jgi:hypothetical protein
VEKYSAARQAKCDNIIRHMRTTLWIPEATDTHSEYAILTVFPRQQWLHKSAPLSLYTYITSLGLWVDSRDSNNHWKHALCGATFVLYPVLGTRLSSILDLL